MSPSIVNGRLAPIGEEIVPVGQVMFVRDEFRCTCSDLYYCNHIRRFFQRGEDVGQHTVISRTRLFEISHLHLPLTNGVKVRVKLTVVENPVDKREVMLYVCEAREGAEVSAYMTREDSFEPFIRAMRDHYMSLPLTTVCFEKLSNRKRPPCPSEGHNRACDVQIAKAINDVLSLWADTQEKFELEIAEMAIENAYHISVTGMCSGCMASRIDPLNIPDDLIPRI